MSCCCMFTRSILHSNAQIYVHFPPFTLVILRNQYPLCVYYLQPNSSFRYSAVVLEHIIKHISSGTGIFASKDPKLTGCTRRTHTLPSLPPFYPHTFPGFAELDGRKWSCPAFNAVKEGRAALPTSGTLAFRLFLDFVNVCCLLLVTRCSSIGLRACGRLRGRTTRSTKTKCSALKDCSR
jgi:hypothetical protein